MTQGTSETIDQIALSVTAVIKDALVVIYKNAVEEERDRLLKAMDAYIDDEVDDDESRAEFKAEVRRRLL